MIRVFTYSIKEVVALGALIALVADREKEKKRVMRTGGRIKKTGMITKRKKTRS